MFCTLCKKIISADEEFLVSEYDDTIKIIADKMVMMLKKWTIRKHSKNATSEFTTFKDILKNDFENYNTVSRTALTNITVRLMIM